MSSSHSSPLFNVAGFDVDVPLFISIVCILCLGVIQLTWPAIQAYFEAVPVDASEKPEMPIIETISEDHPRKEAPRKRFVKDKASIADWAAQGPASDLDKYTDKEETSIQDPNTILPAGLERMSSETKVDGNGRVLDLDGTVVEEGQSLFRTTLLYSTRILCVLTAQGTIAYIRQQIIDRVINTGAAGGDENDSATMKLDIIKSIKQLSDPEVVEWYTQNKQLLKY